MTGRHSTARGDGSYRDSLRLMGAGNFRSLGGLPAAGGRRIRPHALLRADRLAGLDADDWARLASVGIATICDLRSDAERAEYPSAIPGHLAIRELTCRIRNDLRADPSLARLLARDPTARGTERVMIEIYRRFPGYMGPTLRAVFDRLLEGGTPMLVHCSAGKDRTGFVIAMLLHALEVPEPVIRADYLASRGWPGADSHRASLATLLGAVVPAPELPAAVEAVLDVREPYLDAALDAATTEFGSVTRYLEIAASLDADRQRRLRDALLA